MLAIKLRPVGRKGQRSFRIVVVEARSKLKGQFTEDIGWVNRHTDGVHVDTERAKYWLSVGAQPTDTVHNVLVHTQVIPGPKRPMHKIKPKAEEPAEEKPEESATEAATPEVSVEAESSEAPADAPVEESVPEEPTADPSPIEEPKEA